MHGNGDLVSKRHVIQGVDREEEQDAEEPATDRDDGRFEEQRRMPAGELVRPCGKDGGNELSEGN